LTDLSEPRRTSGWTPVLTALDLLRQFILPLVVVIAFNAGDIMQSAISAGGLIIVFTGSRLVSWLRQRWWVEDDRLRVRSGLLQIDDRTIPVDRIQRIDRNQTLVSRFLGLYELKAETAGGSGSELSLRYLSGVEADALERWLEERRLADLGDQQVERVEELLTETPFRDLIIGGATSNRIGALAVLVGTAFQLFDDATSDTYAIIERWFPAIAEPFSSGSRAIAAGAVIVLLALVVGWVASIATTVLRFFEFRLVLTDDELRRSHGLLSRFQASSPLHRIQAVRIEQPLLRRVFGYSSVIAETAGSPGGDGGGSGMLTPIAPNGPALALTARVLGPEETEITSLQPVSRLTIRRGFIRALMLLSLPVAGIVFLAVDSGPAAWLGPPLLGVIAALWYSRARFRALGYRVSDGHIVTREGVLTRRWWSVPLPKVQTIAVRRSPFQRRLGLATVSVDTAGGSAPIRIVDLPGDLADEIGMRLIEKSTASYNADAV
jgi:putative membrane protein